MKAREGGDGNLCGVAGDLLTGYQASDAIVQHASGQGPMNVGPMAQVELARGNLIAASRWADEAVSTTTGWYQMLALTTRARVTRARGESDALVRGAEIQARVGVSDILECLADLRGDAGSALEAARLLGAAHAIRERIGEVRLQIYQAG